MRSVATPDPSPSWARRATVVARAPAMGTLFEVVLVGDDDNRLRSAASDALAEIARVERLLSRFDPAAEIHRLNREGRDGWVRVDRELFAILKSVMRYRAATDGWFDPFRRSPRETGEPEDSPLQLDHERSRVRFAHRDVQLDLGAFGKGYALDAMRSLLFERDVYDWLVSGGGSSIATAGRRADGTNWIVGLENPFETNAEGPLHVVERTLEDVSLSTSMTLAPGPDVGATSDVVDPRTGERIIERASCTVIHELGAVAEVLSTALLAMGRIRAGDWLKRFAAGEIGLEAEPSSTSVFWIGEEAGEARVEPLHGDSHVLVD